MVKCLVFNIVDPETGEPIKPDFSKLFDTKTCFERDSARELFLIRPDETIEDILSCYDDALVFRADLSGIEKKTYLAEYFRNQFGPPYPEYRYLWEADSKCFTDKPETKIFFVLSNLQRLVIEDPQLGTRLTVEFANLAFRLNIEGHPCRILVHKPYQIDLSFYEEGKINFNDETLQIDDVKNKIDEVGGDNEIPLISVQNKSEFGKEKVPELEQQFANMGIKNVSFWGFD